MEYELKRFNQSEESQIPQELWKEFHIFRKKFHDENEQNEPYLDDKTFQTIIKTELEREDFITDIYLVYVEKKMVGYIFLNRFSEKSPSYKGNEKILQFRVDLDKDYRGKGLGTKLMNEVYQYAKKYSKEILTTDTSIEDGLKFLEKIGAEVGLSMSEVRLYLDKVDWKMVDTWIEEAEKLNPDTKLEIFHKVPEGIIENYSKTFTFAGNQSPRDNKAGGDFVFTPETLRQREKANVESGITPIIGATIEPDGTVSGLTELLTISSMEDVSRQNLTAVLSEYRGKKIGKWLKAAALKHLKENYPKIKFVQSMNANSNAPMLAINEKLGFMKEKEVFDCQITVDKLQEYFETKGQVSSGSIINVIV